MSKGSYAAKGSYSCDEVLTSSKGLYSSDGVSSLVPRSVSCRAALLTPRSSLGLLLRCAPPRDEMLISSKASYSSDGVSSPSRGSYSSKLIPKGSVSVPDPTSLRSILSVLPLSLPPPSLCSSLDLPRSPCVSGARGGHLSVCPDVLLQRLCPPYHLYFCYFLPAGVLTVVFCYLCPCYSVFPFDHHQC